MRKKVLSLIALVLCQVTAHAQLLTWSPEFPTENSTITITVDASKGNQGLFNYAGDTSKIYVHCGVTTNLSGSGGQQWLYVNGNTGGTWGSQTPALKAWSLNNNKYQFTITNIRSFFGVPSGETIQKIAIIFRDANASASAVKKQVNSDGSDMFIPIYPSTGDFVKFRQPFYEPRFVPYLEPITATVGQQVPAKAVSSSNGTLNLYFNNNLVTGPLTGTNTITGSPTITTVGNQVLRADFTTSNGTVKDSVLFLVTPTVPVAPLPSGVVEGINYLPDGSVTLVLYAPNKNNVIVIGDFPNNNWTPKVQFLMNRTPDGNYYWLNIGGLTSGTEYSYQYLVDNSIKIADPYAEKILDPYNDPYISSVTYPNLKPYPTGLTTDLVGILQTGAPAYNWQVTNFTKPDKKNLVIYELLIRDFTVEHSYQSLIDSFQYFKNLGINAIQLMPVNEFDGNESWGYNPAFYFAPDKYYGPKNKLKEFIDKCHQNGIAVLLDVVYNHCTGNAPQAKLYWDAANSRPTADNPWLNTIAPHPYSVYNDFNHTAAPTRYLVQRALDFWVKEYKVDGYRFDLAKGFTQTQTNTSTVENYDASRVNNLKRYYDSTQLHYPGTIMTLEFLGTQRQEEQEYASMGYLLWSNNNSTYNEATKGFIGTGANFSKVVYSSNETAFTTPAAIGYMESHDEERLMYRNLTQGNSSGSYNVKNLSTALDRQAAAAAVFFTVPGPKLFWQFGERGYDESINYGGSNVANKPPHWEYMQQADRLKLYSSYSKMIAFRLANPAVFNATTFNYNFSNDNLLRFFQIADPASNGVKVTVVANLGLAVQSINVTFQATGTWYNYITNGTGTGINGAAGTSFSLSTAAQTISLQPGEYHIYATIPPCTTPTPVVNSPVSYCQGVQAVPLTATGTGLLWYTSATGTGSSTAPTPSTATPGSVTYYVSQTIGCESQLTPIVVNVTASTPAPTVTTPVTYCQGVQAAQLTATGTSLLWYTAPSGGTGNATAPTPSTTNPGSLTYYVSQTLSCGEGPRAAIVVNVTPLPGQPGTSPTVTYCQGVNPSALTASGSGLLWYTAPTGGTGTSVAPIPSTANPGNTSYYVSQTVNGCEGPRAVTVVTVNPTPATPSATSPVTYCQNSTAIPLSASGSNLLWYTAATGGSGSSTAPTPVTTSVGSTSYYVSQTVNNCESPRRQVVVNIVSSTPAPDVTSPVNYCVGSSAGALTATGTSLLWYTQATGGSGSSTAPTPSTSAAATVTYYVSQTLSCGEGPRASIVVNVYNLPGVPGVTSPVTYCQGTNASPLSASGSNLLWYTASTGGTGSATAPTPLTNNPGNTNYYVSQTTNGCEGPRQLITVTVNPLPGPPGVNPTVSYCQGVNPSALTATGTSLLWYTVATGGTGVSTAPTPVTSSPGTTTYYVSQTVNNCEGPRSSIAVTVNPLPALPGVTSPLTYCQLSPATQLSATGNNLLWYTVATGGTGSSVAPTPSTTAAGSNSYYVSQSNSCGESGRANIVVNVTPTPAAPSGLTVTGLTNSAATLNWTTVSGVFYIVQYKTDAAGTWTTITNATNGTATLNALTAATTYQWRVSANCDASANNNFTTGTFTTQARNSTITQLRNGLGLKITPNPVIGAAIIDYIVPGSGTVNISLLNATGQHMSDLFSAVQAAGQYQYDVTKEFNSLASGVYIILLQQNGKTQYLQFLKK